MSSFPYRFNPYGQNWNGSRGIQGNLGLQTNPSTSTALVTTVGYTVPSSVVSAVPTDVTFPHVTNGTSSPWNALPLPLIPPAALRTLTPPINPNVPGASFVMGGIPVPKIPIPPTPRRSQSHTGIVSVPKPKSNGSDHDNRRYEVFYNLKKVLTCSANIVESDFLVQVH